MPQGLRELNGVNLEDSDNLRQHILPVFQYNQAVIDFYLSQVVFPREAKEFPQKLSTSAWDLAQTKTHVTTGFSGTNDNHWLLPTSISQQDPVNQLGTNAKVLSYLLQAENHNCLCVQDKAGQPIASRIYLELLVKQSSEIRVLLDVGAQMLDMQNIELAKDWLSLRDDPHIKAAIFFNESDELVVVSRDGYVESLVASPFSQQLDQCLVYLDDAHTRGTDLKLPSNTRAAVTLGPRVTKDRLLQGQYNISSISFITDGVCYRLYADAQAGRWSFNSLPCSSRSLQEHYHPCQRWADERSRLSGYPALDNENDVRANLPLPFSLGRPGV